MNRSKPLVRKRNLTARTSMRRGCGRKQYPGLVEALKACELRAAKSTRPGRYEAKICRFACKGAWHAVFTEAAEETGFSPAVRKLVRTRAGSGDPGRACCEACGVFLGGHGGQIQHIYARQAGGSRGRLYRSAACGAMLCGTPYTGCHGLCESRSAHMFEAGFWRKRNGQEKPGDYPILLHGEFGGARVWLTPEGGYSEYSPVARGARGALRPGRPCPRDGTAPISAAWAAPDTGRGCGLAWARSRAVRAGAARCGPKRHLRGASG